jgi:DNA-binding MarR family transcriptional regulator
VPVETEDGPRVSYLLARLERAFRGALDECLAELGLTTPQYAALSILKARTGLSNAQLARRCFVTPQSMSEVILGLERNGLIRRAPDRANRRILRTVLTPEGQRMLAACDAAVDEMEQTMLVDVPARTQRELRDSLLECVHALTERRLALSKG